MVALAAKPVPLLSFLRPREKKAEGRANFGLDGLLH